jgi:hypothetical protein
MRHKVPVHLETPDMLLLNMTARQTLVVALGITLAYITISGVWSIPLLLVPAMMFAAAILIGAFLLAFVAPKKRHLDVWAVVVLNFLISPKCYAWRPLPPDGNRPSMATENEGLEPGAEED